MRSPITDTDLYLFNQGSHFHLADKLGAHPLEGGTHMAVWAPNAEFVSVIGDHNGWDKGAEPLQRRGDSGIWEGFLTGVGAGAVYKYHVVGPGGVHRSDKADPLARFAEVAPGQGSVVWDLAHEWGDGEWLKQRSRSRAAQQAWSIYEVHLGSWRRVPHDGNRSLSYRELAPQLADYVEWLGFTHVELLPVMEHPFFGSWGYQVTGYFAPSSRYGTPQDFKYLIDYLHQRGIGVILDWVPSHFPTDGHGLGYFDGTNLYEHADPRQGFHPEWKSNIFNYARHEVRSFLISSALWWLEQYHADGLRVDGVASMLYLDYAREPGEWLANEHGGRESLGAVELLRRMNSEIYATLPDTETIAEESTSWPAVSRPTYVGGLGFGMKWDLGWMHDTLEYLELDGIHRKFHHGSLTFRRLYAFSENFVLPLSHDEVVHSKGSLLGKMAGDDWQKFANLRLLYGWMWASPGKKLLFMGGEFGQRTEWSHDSSLDWDLTWDDRHAGIQRWIRDLNGLYRSEPALHRLDFDPRGFEWVDANDSEQSIISLLRTDGERSVLAAFNFTPVPRPGYRLGVPTGGYWRELLNSDAGEYCGSGMGNLGGVPTAPVPCHGRPHSVQVVLPPLAAVFFALERGESE